MIVQEYKIRVRYKETDAMGVVHHSNYVNYYEVARTELLRGFGTTYKEMEQGGVMMPIREVQMKFIAPALYDDLLTVRITVSEVPAARMTFYHEVFNEKGDLLNTGTVVLAFMNQQTRRPTRAPEAFRALFAPYFE